jgi:multisubunit Na+/H+ antiporter MnhE subunit
MILLVIIVITFRRMVLELKDPYYDLIRLYQYMLLLFYFLRVVAQSVTNIVSLHNDIVDQIIVAYPTAMWNYFLSNQVSQYLMIIHI